MPKRALVTGANRGIGYGIAKGLLKEGLDVVIGARDASSGAEAAQQLQCGHIQLDVADLGSIERAIDDIGAIDVLVNNAGVLYEEPMLENPAHFEQSMQVMLHGPFHLIRRVAPSMAEKQYGRIVNVSSEWGSFAQGLEAPPGPYGVAKAALNALTLALARELPSSVKINAMCPGWVATEMGGSSAPLSVEQGADTAVWLATLDDDGPTGGFFQNRHHIGW
ncbi:3-oxoacyl-[acyl-carrier-protein] reductase FabG [Pseudovibrio axinellae]|uniref:3-oxoacyl-[acyl-carrier-protein] reductase FabG n=1 Tax=Pseudovibrio axinellae TaxID=989403 RepID=A0A165T3P2_9HYPH|nr:SDR family NAD(P)-dependent oxidoreductase [Pseudovibrio axinellae]KZL05383.1 3-oxoacyl-[acyl-carrier-protein] reductase FabG [Pseudovibrio axinellae]SER37341.1 Short-chain dehydrogenase [Pseudovibrio axinellae]